MKKTGVWIGIFMMVSVLIGLFLPGFTLELQDKKISDQVDEYKARSAGLPYDNDVIDSLRLVSEGYKRYDDVSRGTIHTEKEIMESIEDLLYRFGEYGINFVDDMDFIIFSDSQYFLALSKNSEDAYSTVIWKMTVKNRESEPVITFYFDDASGKMVSFEWYFPEMEKELQQGEETVSYPETAGQITASYDTWGNVDMLLYNGISDFFREYYDLDFAEDSLFGENQDTYLEFIFTEKKYGDTRIPVWIYQDRFYFNPGL